MARSFWVFFPMSHKSLLFSDWLMESGAVFGPMWEPGTDVSSNTLDGTHIQGGALCMSLWFSLPEILSFMGLWLQTLTFLISVDSQHNFLFFFGLFAFSRATSSACGGSQARGQIRAVADGLRQSHSNAGPEPHLQPTPQLTATSVPQPTEQGQGSNLQPHGS